jgi:hypothetical protein
MGSIKITAIATIAVLLSSCSKAQQAAYDCIANEGLYQTHENDSINRCFERWCIVESRKVRSFYNDPNLQELAHWSPDGKSFAATGNGRQVLYLVTAKGFPTGKLYQVDADRQFVNQPLWSPDGKSVAFLVSVSNTYSHIMLAEPKNPDIQQVTPANQPSNHYKQPIGWSNDSKHLFFTDIIDPQPSNGTQYKSLYRWTRATRQFTKIVDASAKFSEFALSPDGQQIALSDGNAFKSAQPIHLINSNGTNLHSLGYVGNQTVWSPDSQKLAFTIQDQLGNRSIALETLKTPGKMQIIHAPGQLESVSWIAWFRDSRSIALGKASRDNFRSPVQLIEVSLLSPASPKTLTTWPANLARPHWSGASTPPWRPTKCTLAKS